MWVTQNLATQMFPIFQIFSTPAVCVVLSLSLCTLKFWARPFLTSWLTSAEICKAGNRRGEVPGGPWHCGSGGKYCGGRLAVSAGVNVNTEERICKRHWGSSFLTRSCDSKDWWQLGVIPRASTKPSGWTCSGIPSAIPARFYLVSGSSCGPRSKNICYLVGLLRDSHLKVFFFISAFVLFAGCSQSSPAKPRNDGCILPCGFVFPGFWSIRKFPKLLLCLKSRASDPRLGSDQEDWKVTNTECLSWWFQVQNNVKCWWWERGKRRRWMSSEEWSQDEISSF